MAEFLSKRGQRLPRRTGSLAGALWDIVVGSAAGLAALGRRWGREYLWWRHTVPAELRSLVHRIRILRERRMGLDGVECGALYSAEAGGGLRVSLETIARTRDIGDLFASRPGVSVGDVLLFLDGWEKGKEFGRGRAGSARIDADMSSETRAVVERMVFDPSVDLEAALKEIECGRASAVQESQP